jgi:hypothetical protein
MPLTRRRVDGQTVRLQPNTWVTVFTFNPGITVAGGMLQGVILNNRSATAREVEVAVMEQGTVQADSKVVWTGTVGDKSTEVAPPLPLYCNSGAFVQVRMVGGTLGDINATAVAIEETS